MAATRSELSKLHAMLAEALREEIQKEDRTPSALNVARQFLKDSGIEVDPDRKPKSMSELEEAFNAELEELPQFSN